MKLINSNILILGNIITSKNFKINRKLLSLENYFVLSIIAAMARWQKVIDSIKYFNGDILKKHFLLAGGKR